MTQPKNSLMKQYSYLFQLNGIDFHVTEGGLSEIAKTAHSRGTGARGLRAITEQVRMDEERSDELRTLTLGTKAVRACTSVQDAHPP